MPFFGMGSNKKSQDYYRKIRNRFINLGAIISSDGHSLDEIGSSYSNLETIGDYDYFKSKEDVIRFLRSAILSRSYPSGRMHNSLLPAIGHVVNVYKKVGIKGVKAKLFKKN